MSNYLRPRIHGATVFFTVNLADRDSSLLVDEIARLRAAVRHTQSERPFHIDAWVVLPDHLHAIWTLPKGDADFSTRWRLIKSRFSHGLPKGPLRASHRLRQERGVWQRRFWEHHVRGGGEYGALLRYCWMNPVKHGLAEAPQDWMYSSVHRDVASGRFDLA